MATVAIPCAIIRGGTTKGIYIDSDHLPQEPEERDRLILSLFGSPDTRQINGLGGADPLTSKVALISRSSKPGADIEYTSGEVGIDEAVVNYSTMCGNLAAGAALYAIEFGLVQRTDPVTKVRIHNGNTGKQLSVAVPTMNGDYLSGLSEEVDNVKGRGVKLRVAFHDPAGAITGVLLPTRHAVDLFNLPGLGDVPCSIVDCGTLYGFVRAETFGLSGKESPKFLDNRSVFKEMIEVVRAQVAEAVNQYQTRSIVPRQVKIAIIAKPPHRSAEGADLPFDLVARVINRYKTHKAYPVTGAVCLCAAGAIPGTLAYDSVGQRSEHDIRIAHPGGIISIQAHYRTEQGKCRILSTELVRSARLLMKGTAYADVARPVQG